VNGHFQGIQFRSTVAHELPGPRPADLCVRIGSPARPSDGVDAARQWETA
jgi:hypothetical protein